MKGGLKRIGIVGFGFVGSAIAQGFSLHAEIKIYDKFRNEYDSLEDVCRQDIIFLSVPTPVSKDGSQCLDAVYEVVPIIADISERINVNPIIVVKSTVLPGTSRKLTSMYRTLRFVSNPEFLTARSARLDFINPARVIIGGNPDDMSSAEAVKDLYTHRFGRATTYFVTSWEAAELAKYMCNCFFALKISYLNEIYDVCKMLDVDYGELKAMFLSDGRIGHSHADVPGFDGDFGFGGTCLPKDLKSFNKWCFEERRELYTLKAAAVVNEIKRTNCNWEEV